MSDEVKEIGLAQVAVRVLFACAATVILGFGAFMALRWLFGH